MDLYPKFFVVAVVVLFAAALHAMMSPFWGALAWGVCLAIMLMPAHGWLTRRLRGRGGWAAGLITTLVPLAVVTPLISFGLAFFSQVVELSGRLKQRPFRIDAGLLAQLEQVPMIGRLAGLLRVHLSATTEQLEVWLDRGVDLLLAKLAGTGGNFLLDAIGTVAHFFLMLFLLFFLLRDGRLLLARVVRLVPMEAQRSSALLKLIGDTIYAVIFGVVLTALAQGALVGIGFAIAGLPSAIVFGVLAAGFALLPLGGAAIVWLPGVVYLFINGQTGWAIFLLVWGSGVSVIDNLMRPLLISHQAPVSTLAVFVGVIGGLSAFGMIGIVIGPVLLTVLVALLRFVAADLPENQ